MAVIKTLIQRKGVGYNPICIETKLPNNIALKVAMDNGIIYRAFVRSVARRAGIHGNTKIISGTFFPPLTMEDGRVFDPDPDFTYSDFMEEFKNLCKSRGIR